MILLILGLLIWAGVHAIPLAMPGRRAMLIESLGQGAYKGLFALSIVLSIVLMVLGWRMIGFVPVYEPPVWGKHAAGLGMVVAFLLFGAAKAKTNLKRFIRHPQLLSIVVWGGSHLLANGDLRAIVLFSGMALWAVSAMLMSNARDGAWIKPAPFPRAGDIRWIVISLIAFAIVVLLHPYLFGVYPY